jgi:nucleolar GTP-binding protein
LLFDNIKPLFATKPLLVVASKSDSKKLDDLEPAEREEVERWLADSGATMEEMSSHNDEGVSHVKTTACEMLLEQRTAVKMSR